MMRSSILCKYHTLYRTVFSLLMILFSVISHAQKDTIDFPGDFLGEWHGDLKIYSTTGFKQSVPMELHILPIDSMRFEWTLIYGEDKETGKRPYEMIIVDKSKGHFEIDEKNSILLDSYVLGGKFYQRFDVSGSNLLVSLEKIAENLIFEIVVSKTEPLRTTGDTVTEEGEQIPAVNSYQMMVRQRAFLSLKQ